MSRGRAVRSIAAACAAVGAVALMAGGTASAAFPGTNGKIGFSYDAPPAGGVTSIGSVDPDGQSFAELTSPGSGVNDYDPSYSADGELLAFIRVPQPANSGQVWTMNADGSSQTQLTAGTDTAQDFGPEFSPDGKWIVFDRYNGAVTTQVWIMRADGSDQTQLTFASDSSRSPSFSPDGTKIVFSRSSSANMGDEIWTMNADGSDPQPLTTASTNSSDSDPSYSPDGQKIVFDRDNGSDSSIFVMNASDGSGQAPVANGSQSEISPTFSPQGTSIAFVLSGTGSGDLVLVDPDGSNPAPVPGATEVYEQSPITWQPLNPPSCELSGNATQKSVKSVSITVTCANENATVSAAGSGKAPKVPKGAIASKAKKFTIPAVTAQVPAATPTTVTLTIPKKAQKALKKASKAGKKGKATITATLTDDLAQAATDTFKVKFKAKKKK